MDEHAAVNIFELKNTCIKRLKDRFKIKFCILETFSNLTKEYHEKLLTALLTAFKVGVHNRTTSLSANLNTPVKQKGKNLNAIHKK